MAHPCFHSNKICLQNKPDEKDEYSLETYRLSREWLRHLHTSWPSLLKIIHHRPPVGTLRNGKKIYARRDVAFISDAPGYNLNVLPDSTLASEPLKNWPLLQLLIAEVNRHMDEFYDSIIVNYYENGFACVSPHCDNPKANGKHGVTTISLGAPRIYRIRERGIENAPVYFDLLMEDGFVVAMKRKFQEKFTHEVPADYRVKKARMSLTFRSLRQGIAAAALSNSLGTASFPSPKKKKHPSNENDNESSSEDDTKKKTQKKNDKSKKTLSEILSESDNDSLSEDNGKKNKKDQKHGLSKKTLSSVVTPAEED